RRPRRSVHRCENGGPRGATGYPQPVTRRPRTARVPKTAPVAPTTRRFASDGSPWLLIGAGRGSEQGPPRARPGSPFDGPPRSVMLEGRRGRDGAPAEGHPTMRHPPARLLTLTLALLAGLTAQAAGPAWAQPQRIGIGRLERGIRPRS